MARLPSYHVRDMNPPEDVVPPEAWRAVLHEAGHLVIGRAKTFREVDGSISLRVVVDEVVLERVKRILARFDLCDETEVRASWERDPDWWRG